MKLSQKSLNPHSKNYSILYETDFLAWINQTVQNLENRQLNQIDYDNLIEELKSMGRSEKHAVFSSLKVVLMHLLKYAYQPQMRSNSWRYTIIEHRNRLKRKFKDSPSLKRYTEQIFTECYEDARLEAATETGLGLEVFPINSPFTLSEALNLDYLPE